MSKLCRWKEQPDGSLRCKCCHRSVKKPKNIPRENWLKAKRMCTCGPAFWDKYNWTLARAFLRSLWAFLKYVVTNPRGYYTGIRYADRTAVCTGTADEPPCPLYGRYIPGRCAGCGCVIHGILGKARMATSECPQKMWPGEDKHTSRLQIKEQLLPPHNATTTANTTTEQRCGSCGK